MQAIIRQRSASLARMVLPVLLVLASCAGLFAGCAEKAYAADDVYLETGGSIPYAGYFTTWMHAGGNIAFCGDPAASAPSPGSYAKSDLTAPSGRTAEIAADLWFGYGSPGFDASLWPDTWYDGSAMTEEHYVALSHILLSDTFTSSGDYALHGCSEAFREWARQNVIGYGTDGKVINENATGIRIAARQGELPSNFTPFMLHTGEGMQLVLSFTYVPDGFLQVHKASADTSITLGNPNYSLAGAEYGVYDANGNQVTVLTTDAAGDSGVSGALLIGSYTVRETRAAPGFALDGRTYAVTISPDGWDSNRVVALTPDAEVPQTGTDAGALTVSFSKLDLETGVRQAQGASTLEGATFVVKHYPLAAGSVTDAGELSGAVPDYTWTITTDATGTARIGTWTSADGNATEGLPLGVCTIEETRAPEGYLLSTAVRVFDVVGSGSTQHFDMTDLPGVSDQVERGDIELIKISDGDSARMAGVPFTITSEATGETHTIVTDVNGYASTAASWNSHRLDTNASTATSGIWFGTGSADDGHGALIYGTYTVAEQPCAANAGKEIIHPFEITVSRDGYTVNLGTLTDDDKPHVSISKTDMTTGMELPGATLQIIDGNGDVVEEWVSTDIPHEVTLDSGDYTLHEEIAPDGYLVASDVTFTVVEGAVSQKVEMKDDCTRTDFSKTDAMTGTELAGAHLQVLDRNGTVVAEWDSDGTVHRIDRLTPGDYMLRETAAPDGYEIAEDVTFTVPESGDVQKVEMRDKATPAPATPTTPVTSTTTAGTGSLPKTGDDFPWWIVAIMGGVGACVLGGATIARRRGGDTGEVDVESEE